MPSDLYETVRRHLTVHYPDGQAWEAILSEAEHNFDLNGERGCQDIEGVAVDLDGDRRADRFLFKEGFFLTSYTAERLDRYLQPLASFPPSGWHWHPSCRKPAQGFMPTGFPFDGEILPDTHGKITSIMFTATPDTVGAVTDLLTTRPDLKAHVLTAEEDDSILATLNNGRFVFSPAGIRESDWDPRQTEIFIQDQFWVGINEYGDPFVGAAYERDLGVYAPPLMQTMGAGAVTTDFWPDPSDVLASSTHLFVPANTKLPWDANWLQLFGQGKTIVEVDVPQLKYDLSLDMLLTPTEEMRDGKPVVLVASGAGNNDNPLLKNRRPDLAGLDRLASELKQKGFHVMRLPVVVTTLDPRPQWEVISPDSRHHDLTYNNVLMERYREGGKRVRRVYMPWYDFGAQKIETNEWAKNIFKELGYEVIPIRNMNSLGLGGGGLRSIVKVTSRQL